METNTEDLNRYQIIRKDARGCFVETKSDSFGYGKVHMEFSQYDATRPAGQRQTNHVNIYINIPEFLLLAHEAMSGALHMRGKQQRSNGDSKPLFEHLGGTSAEKLRQLKKPRPDGKSLSRIVKLLLAKEDGDYLFVADNGPGEADAKGLIVPRFGKTPENHVSVKLNWRSLNELLLITQVHYGAWLAAQYVKMPEPQRYGDQNGSA